MKQENSVMLVGNFLAGSRLYENVNAGLARGLTSRGWSVQTTSRWLFRPRRLVDMVGTVWRRRRTYRVAQVDVFSGPAFMWAEAVCWTLRRASRPYVLALRGGDLPAFSRRHPWRVERLLSHASAVTAPSPYLRTELARFRGDIQVIPNPLDVSAHPFRQREEPRPHLVWVRAFHGNYNPALAVRVVAGLVTAFPDTRLFMVGPDKRDGSRQAAEDLARKLGVHERISFTGIVPKSDVPGWLDRGDVFLNTTNVDNTPVSVLEAMGCGLCIVSTNPGGIPHLLTDGQDALLVPRDDVGAMAAAVKRILTERGLAAKLSSQGRARVEPFDWSVVLPQWEELLQRAAL